MRLVALWSCAAVVLPFPSVMALNPPLGGQGSGAERSAVGQGFSPERSAVGQGFSPERSAVDQGFSPERSAVDQGFSPEGPAGQEVRLARSARGLPIVTVYAGRELLRLGLDTGTSRTLISASAASRLGLAARERLVVASVAGPPQAGLCGSGPQLRLSGLLVTPDCLGWLPGEPAVAGAEDLDGILGSDLLAQVDLWIDLQTTPVRARFAPAGSLARWVDGPRLSLQTIGRRYGITCRIEGLRQHHTSLLVIDSAADVLVLFGDTARRTAAGALQERTHATVASATARRGVTMVPMLGVRSSGSFFPVPRAGVLPDVTGRDEDGLLPLNTLGPVLLDPVNGILVAHARFRSAPREERR